MAKYKLQELNDLRDEGKRRVYPKMVTNRTLSRKEFVKMMQNYHRGISESTTEAVLTDVVDMLADMLSMGYNVNLEGFGTFSLSLAFEDEKPREILNPDDKMTYRKVGVKDINFKASPEFARALEVIEKNGVLTLGDYASINNLSRTAASMELKELTCDKSSPIDSLGRGSHKVWVKRKE